MHSVGELIDYYYNKGNNYRFKYVVNDKKYYLTKRAYIGGLVKGEYYFIEYDSLDPKRAKVDLTRPIIKDTSLYTGSTGKIIDIEDSQHGRIEYKYTYNNNVYKRIQYFNSMVNIGDDLEILIFKTNPKISYIIKQIP